MRLGLQRLKLLGCICKTAIDVSRPAIVIVNWGDAATGGSA
jgi:hypothetical protein